MEQAFLKELAGLARVNVDTFHANEQALKNVDVPRLQLRIQHFQQDHERHALELAATLERHGAVPPALVQDLKGYLIEGYTALRSVTGLEGALRALLRNERMVNRAYDAVLELELPPTVRELLRANRQDERQHYQGVRDMLDTRVRVEAREFHLMPNFFPLPPQWARSPPGS